MEAVRRPSQVSGWLHWDANVFMERNERLWKGGRNCSSPLHLLTGLHVQSCGLNWLQFSLLQPGTPGCKYRSGEPLKGCFTPHKASPRSLHSGVPPGQILPASTLPTAIQSYPDELILGSERGRRPCHLLPVRKPYSKHRTKKNFNSPLPLFWIRRL